MRTVDHVARYGGDEFLVLMPETELRTTVAKAEGIWIEDHSGRRWMDFHGNSVHHIGYAHPRVLAAIFPATVVMSRCT